MITRTTTKYKIDTDDYKQARAYNQGYQHGLEDTKSRALVSLWKAYLKYKDLDPDLAKLIREAISEAEKLK